MKRDNHEQEIERLRSRASTLEQLLQVHEATALSQTRRLEQVIRSLEAKSAEVVELNRELENRVVSRTSELQAAVHELEAFCYSVSHDLRAPLRTLDGFSLALLEDYDDKLDEDGRVYLARIRANSQKMAELIDSLLQLSRLGRMEMKYEDVNLSELALQGISELQNSQPRQQVNVHIEPLIHTRGDLGLLRAAMVNLVSNAWKFTSKTESPYIEFGIAHRPEGTVCYLRDNGAGFDMKYSPKLFGAFQRLHHPSEFEGTGVGLATVQRIIRRHGGQIWAEGEPNQGATFYFTLPELQQVKDKCA